MNCEKKYPDKDSDFLNCSSSSCPSEGSNFKSCVRQNKKYLENCFEAAQSFEKCMTKFSTKIIQILSKSHSFKN
jgi:hypothetical protein